MIGVSVVRVTASASVNSKGKTRRWWFLTVSESVPVQVGGEREGVKGGSGSVGDVRGHEEVTVRII